MLRNPIQLLPDDLINKIAAGEVVERPASVLKELIENALDAEASEITVELTDGGKKMLIVSDNGTGMSEADALRSIQRHATSKIRSLDDLFQVQSMGFRGEALASIASVARLTLITTERSEAEGRKIEFLPDANPKILPSKRSQGTTILCEDLFYNVPARAKFLKTAAAEYSQCLELMQNLALIHPEVSFRLEHQGKEVLQAPRIEARDDLGPTETLRRRFAQLFPKEMPLQNNSVQLIPVEAASQWGTLHGLVSPPGVEKLTTRHLFTYVNGRYVKDKNLRMAITRGYHSHLLKGRYPVVILDFRCDPSLVDANVHPAKTEVRFQYAGDVQSMIAEAIRNALRQENWVQPKVSHTLDFAHLTPESNPQRPMRETTQPPPRPVVNRPMNPASIFSSEIARPRITVQTFAPAERNLFDAIDFPTKDPSPQSATSTIPWQDLALIGSFADCYLFFELRGEQKLLVVDQHAFHERILYEKFMQEDADLRECQPLLIPEVIDLDGDSCERLENARDALQAVGFRFVRVGASSIELTGIPPRLQGKNIHALLTELSQFEHLDIRASKQQSHHHLFATLACHSAVRKGDRLSHEDLQRLVRDASTVDFTANCPHGRPVFRWWTSDEVGRWFYRP